MRNQPPSHAWPKESVEVLNILADEMMDLDARILPPVVQGMAMQFAPLMR